MWKRRRRGQVLVVGHERLLVLSIANSAMVGVKSVETDTSLLRFTEATLAVLAEPVRMV